MCFFYDKTLGEQALFVEWYALDICYRLVTWESLCLHSVVINFLYSLLDTDSTKLTRCASGNNEHSLHKVSQHKVGRFIIELSCFILVFLFIVVRHSKLLICCLQREYSEPFN